MKSSLTFIATALVASLSTHAVFADEPVFAPAERIVFDDIIPGTVAFATVMGDRASGAHGTFVQIPAGQATPPHTHDAPYHAVVVQGKLENPIAENESSQVALTAGSYYYVPAKAEHITRCAADSPVACISYFYQDVAFDFKVAE